MHLQKCPTFGVHIKIWQAFFVVKIKSGIREMNGFRFSISFPTYAIQNLLNATLYFRFKPLPL